MKSPIPDHLETQNARLSGKRHQKEQQETTFRKRSGRNPPYVNKKTANAIGRRRDKKNKHVNNTQAVSLLDESTPSAFLV